MNATELIANMLGGYAIKTEDAFYIADNEDLSKAQKVWKWGLGGFGYSENGVDGPYTTAVTAEGSIVAELVSAGIITADMIQAGILQSQDGSLSLNLNNGAFSFNHNVVKFTDSGLKVTHAGSNEYSEINYNGFKRKWQYGESEYLNDFHVITNLRTNNKYDTPRLLTLTLPQRFRNRSKVEVLLILHEFSTGLLYLGERRRALDLVLKVDSINLNTSSPNVKLYAYLEEKLEIASDLDLTVYRDIGFDLIVIGY